MKSLEKEIAELEQKMSDEKSALIAKHKVLDSLESILEGYEPPSIHHGKLYGTKGSIAFKGCDYESLRKGKNPDRELLAALLIAYPPLPKVQVKDGCTSFRPDGQWKGDILDVCPVTVKVETFQSQEARFKWYGKINDEIWEFNVAFPLYKTTLGHVKMDTKRLPGGGDIYEYKNVEFLRNCDCQVIRWASGGSQYPNSFTLWWDIDTGKETDFPEFIKGE